MNSRLLYTMEIQSIQKPEFVIAVCAAAAGIILITALFVITRRIAVNPYDMEEQPFFSEED